MDARAYVNHGRWISDCPRDFCASAEQLRPGQQVFECSNCRLVVGIEWPADPDDIWAVLEQRPVPQTRNWFPDGHEVAVRSGVEHGQSVADLIEENRMYGVVPILGGQ